MHKITDPKELLQELCRRMRQAEHLQTPFRAHLVDGNVVAVQSIVPCLSSHDADRDFVRLGLRVGASYVRYATFGISHCSLASGIAAIEIDGQPKRCETFETIRDTLLRYVGYARGTFRLRVKLLCESTALDCVKVDQLAPRDGTTGILFQLHLCEMNAPSADAVRSAMVSSLRSTNDVQWVEILS